MITRTLATVVTMAAVLATPALAQHQHGQTRSDTAHAMMGGMQMMRGPMMGGGMMAMMQSMHPGPGMILAASDALDLTAEQMDRLRTLRDAQAAQHQAHMQAAMTTRLEASEALVGEEPDLDAFAATLREAAEHMVQGHVAMAATALEAWDVLTTEQREKLHDALSMMHQMRGGMMGEPMRGGSGNVPPHDGGR